MHISDIHWTWLIVSLLSVMSVMGVTEPSEDIVDIGFYHHNDTHAILHINSTELDHHSDLLVLHSDLDGLRVTIEPNSAIHALPELSGDDSSSAAAMDNAVVTEGPLIHSAAAMDNDVAAEGHESTTAVLQDQSYVEDPRPATERRAKLTRNSENSSETSQQPGIKPVPSIPDTKLPPLHASDQPAITEDSPASPKVDSTITSSFPAVKTDSRADSPSGLASFSPETAGIAPVASSPITTIMDSPTAVQQSESSPAAANANTGELGTSTPSPNLETPSREAAPPESEETDDGTSSSEEDDAEDDDGAGWTSPIVNGTVQERGVEAAPPDQKRQRNVTTFAVAMCATVGTIFVALVGVWIYRIRRSDRRRMLEDDDEEFTVFNASERQYSGKSAGRYAPLP